jgi:hypothetical protein
MLIMISGLVIYAIFHKRADSGAAITAPGRE